MTRSFAATATGVPADLPFLFSAGQRFGPYLVVRPIGKGGMGQVYEAEEIESGRRVAIKILSRGIGDDEERERFLQEGRLAASLSHPNTVYVFGTTEVQGFPVIAMELAPSGTLKDLVTPGTPMSIAAAVDAVLQVIDGLEAAASLGILHRDIKPSNCFVAADGRVLVGDFGLSIATLARAGEAAGTILGTPGFASPEQLRGEPLDVRSDIYSVGATIYYLLSGKTPFDDPDLKTMITRVTTEAPPALALSRADVPSRLASIVAKCLAKRPGDRYGSYPALRSALEPFRSASLTPAPLGRRFLAGWLDSLAAALVMMPVNMFLGAAILDTSNPKTVVLATLPTIAVTLVYYTLLEGWFGCGAGKALFNLRVVTAGETSPGFTRAFTRAAIFVIPGQVVRITAGYFAVPGAQQRFNTYNVAQSVLAVVTVAMSAMVFAILFSTVRRRNGFAALHDLASGTRVVVRPRSMDVRKTTVRSSRAATAATTDRERVGPYFVPAGTHAAARAAAAQIFEGFDDRLQRSVWIELLPRGAAAVPAWRRDLGRPGRVRWLSGRRMEDEAWDAYEAVEGQPFTSVCREPQQWSRVRHWVADLGTELAAGLEDGSLESIDSDRIWIGADDRARVCEWTPPGPFRGDAGTRPAARVLDLQDAQRFVYSLAVAALRGTQPGAAPGEPGVPLPLSARAFLLELRDGRLPTPRAMAAAASDLLRGFATFPRVRRATQIAICAFLPVVLPIAVLFAIRFQGAQQTADPHAFQFTACVNQLAAYAKIGDAKLTRQQKERRDLIEVFIAEHLQEQTKEAALVARTFPIVARASSSYQYAERAIARHPARTPEQVKNSEVLVDNLAAANSKSLTALRAPRAQWALAVLMIAWSSAVVGVLSIVGALVTRSGFTLRGAGAALVTARGEPASRLRAVWRALMTWLPVVPALVLLSFSRVQDTNALLALAVTLLLVVLAAGAMFAALHPAHGLQDRAAGTFLVPR